MAPSLCACTAFKLASLIERPGAFWSLRPRPPAAALGVVFAGRALLRFSVVTAFLPNRARTRSAISSSSSSPLSFSRSASRRASRWEIRCFSCSINAVILVVSPWSVDRPPFVVLGYSLGLGPIPPEVRSESSWTPTTVIELTRRTMHSLHFKSLPLLGHAADTCTHATSARSPPYPVLLSPTARRNV